MAETDRDGETHDDLAGLLPERSLLSVEQYLDMQRAIGNEARFRILNHLVDAGPQSAKALRDALGAVEAMLTPPLSERIGAVGYRAADDELDVLSAALNGVPAPDREDLAFADFRYGGYDAALRRRTDFEELAESVLNILREDQLTPDDVLDRLTDRTFPPGASCSNFDLVIVDLAANAAILAGAPTQRRSEGIGRFNEALDDALTAGARCYRKMDDRRIRAGAARLTEAIDRGDRPAARTHALGVAEMVAWAQSNRLREERIGLR
jgi:hypothetical protein